MSISSRTGHSLHEGAHHLPESPRPACKEPGCEKPRTGSYLHRCEFHEERWLEFWQDVEGDARESDRELVW